MGSNCVGCTPNANSGFYYDMSASSTAATQTTFNATVVVNTSLLPQQ